MRTHSSSRKRKASERTDQLPATADSASESVELGHETALRSLAQDQMLVNQALVEKIFACEQTESALRISEQNLHELLLHQQTTREDERKRISRELHDTLGQNLLALRIDIVMMHQQTTSRHYRLRDRIGVALDNVDVTLRSVKQLLGELRPAGFELGLQPTVDLELRKFMRASGIDCKLNSEPGLDEMVMGDDELLVLCRVLQECLNNVFRHSLASRVNVYLSIDDGWLVMRILDNGIGFDPAAPRKTNSYGLLDLHERLASHGGLLIVTSAPGRGTDVSIRIPLGLPPADVPSATAIG